MLSLPGGLRGLGLSLGAGVLERGVRSVLRTTTAKRVLEHLHRLLLRGCAPPSSGRVAGRCGRGGRRRW
jgi:hypothetical protein